MTRDDDDMNWLRQDRYRVVVTYLSDHWRIREYQERKDGVRACGHIFAEGPIGLGVVRYPSPPMPVVEEYAHLE